MENPPTQKEPPQEPILNSSNEPQSPVTRGVLNQFGFLPIVIGIIVIILVIGAAAYYLGTSKNKEQYKAKTTPLQTIPTSTTTGLTPVYIGNYDVVVKVSADSPCNNDIYLHHCKSDISLKDKTTGKETYILTTNDVVKDDSRIPQYRNGYIFLVKRTGNDTYPSNDWTDELWVYVAKDKGVKLFDSKGLTYNANQDGSLVALLLYKDNSPATDSVTLLQRGNNWQPKQYSLDAKQCGFSADTPSSAFDLDLEKWQQESSALWGVYASEYRVVGCYWKLNSETSVVTYYPVPENPRLFALNTDKLVALYTDMPAFVDVDYNKEWLSAHPTYSLYLYSLETKKSIKIATFPSSFNNISPDWDSSTQLHYTSPKGLENYTL